MLGLSRSERHPCLGHLQSLSMARAAGLQTKGDFRSAPKRRRMLANEFDDSDWRPTGEISNRAGDRHRLAAGTLIRGNP
jgi:hypothetical protein